MDTLFAGDGWIAEALHDDGHVEAVQRFFDANPEYFHLVHGQGPAADEARHEFDDLPPPGMSYRERWVIGIRDGTGTLVAVAGVLSNLIAEEVWHVGLFVVATALHGQGTSARIYRQLERWIAARGARWIRLGVVQGSARAERFWERMGYEEVRRRGPVSMGLKSNVLRVMVKRLGDATLDDYLARVQRDRPGAD